MTEQEFALRAQDQRGRLYRTAFLYLGGEHAAVDAVDEAVYRAFRDRRKLRQPEFFETWLTRILINVCKDELRRRRRECRVCVPPEPEAEHMDALSLREAVRALPEELRSVIVLRYFTGLTLEEITPELMRVAQHAAGEAYGLISLVVSFAMEVLESLEQRTVHTSGIAHLLELPEYRSLERAQPLLSYLSEDADPGRFPVPKDDAMKILIGPENVADALKDTSVVMASYDIGDNMRGVIGVVGPTRMDYAKVTARLSYFADSLTRMFGKGELPSGEGDGDGQAQE